MQSDAMQSVWCMHFLLQRKWVSECCLLVSYRFRISDFRTQIWSYRSKFSDEKQFHFWIWSKNLSSARITITVVCCTCLNSEKTSLAEMIFAFYLLFIKHVLIARYHIV